MIWAISLLVLISQIRLGVGVRCFECGYGIPMDLVRFQSAFAGFQIHSRPDPAQRWCTRRTEDVAERMAATLVECEGSCGLTRSSDELSVVVGCIQSVENVTVAHMDVRLARYGYELIVCDVDECNRNAETALKSYNQRKDMFEEIPLADDNPTSTASIPQISAVVFGLIIGLMFFVNS